MSSFTRFALLRLMMLRQSRSSMMGSSRKQIHLLCSAMISLLPQALQVLLGAFIWQSEQQSFKTFTLRHEHGLSRDNNQLILLNNVQPSSSFVAPSYTIQTRDMSVHRPSSFKAFSHARWNRQSPVWDEESVIGPNVTDRQTLLMLAKMTANDYTTPDDKTWYPLDGWNKSEPFGWEPDADGFRGHVFVSDDNSTVVLSIKGTSPGWIPGGSGPTAKKDKINDNLLFSCCCARVGPTWSTYCGCYAGKGTLCDQKCVEDALVEESLFYPVGTNLYNNVTYLYPHATIWLVGHSLGGSLAALLGATFGAPVVAFEAPGDKMASTRLHLPSPPSLQHIHHVYHTADPIAMGVCVGTTSLCAIAGYAMESKCHLGQVIRYDTVTKFGWAVDIRTHGIVTIVEKVLGEDWDKNQAVPDLYDEGDCVDCYKWEFGDFNKSSKAH